MGTDSIVIDEDPDLERPGRVHDVHLVLDDVPPVAVSNGWGDMGFTHRKR